MADTQEVSQLSLLNQLKMQLGQFMAQKDAAQTNLNQLVGAIYATELIIKKHEEDAVKGLTQENLGDNGHGEADKQNQEQAA